jgi:hypothetical protein
MAPKNYNNKRQGKQPVANGKTGSSGQAQAAMSSKSNDRRPLPPVPLVNINDLGYGSRSRASLKNSLAFDESAEYVALLTDPVGTPNGIKMPTFFGTDDRSAPIKSEASYPIYSDALGNAAAYLVGHPNGVYLSPDNTGALRGLDYAANVNFTGVAGYYVNPDYVRGYANLDSDLIGVYATSAALRISAFGAEFRLSNAVLQQQGDVAIRTDYSKRYVQGGSANINFNVYQPEDVVNFTNAANGQEVIVEPATRGFQCFGVPVSGAEDWHATRTIGYKDAADGTPILGYGLSSTDEEQSILLALYSNSLVSGPEFETMLIQSYGAWSTTMIVWQGLPPNTMVGTLNVAMHYEVIPKTKGIDFSNPKKKEFHPDSLPIALKAVSNMPKATFGDKLKEYGGKAIRIGGQVLKSVSPQVHAAVAPIADMVLGKLYGSNKYSF